MNQKLTHKMICELDIEQWQRLRAAVAYSATCPTVAAFVRDAIEQRLRQVEARGPTFEQAWAMSHSDMPPDTGDKARAYRCGPPRFPSARVGQLFSGELQEHFWAGRWDERTAVLIRAQVAECRRRGHALPPAGLNPPGFTAVDAFAAAGLTGTAVTDSEEEEII